MVISTIREYDGFIIVINENNVRYRSIQSDIMAIALHVEAMIKKLFILKTKRLIKSVWTLSYQNSTSVITSNCLVKICFQCKDIK